MQSSSYLTLYQHETENTYIKKFEQSLEATYTFGDRGSSNTGSDYCVVTFNLIEITPYSVMGLPSVLQSSEEHEGPVDL